MSLILDLVDAIRAELPGEARRAREFIRAADRVLAEARTEVEHLLLEADDRAAARAAPRNLAQDVDARVTAIEMQAQQTAEAIRRAADRDAAAVLGHLHAYLDEAKQVVERALGEASEAAQGTPPAVLSGDPRLP